MKLNVVSIVIFRQMALNEVKYLFMNWQEYCNTKFISYVSKKTRNPYSKSQLRCLFEF